MDALVTFDNQNPALGCLGASGVIVHRFANDNFDASDTIDCTAISGLVLPFQSRSLHIKCDATGTATLTAL
jgi:hypothetical protein